MPVPAHIRELVLLGDGDSDRVMTRAALRRGMARHQRDERTVRSLFAPGGRRLGRSRIRRGRGRMTLRDTGPTRRAEVMALIGQVAAEFGVDAAPSHWAAPRNLCCDGPAMSRSASCCITRPSGGRCGSRCRVSVISSAETTRPFSTRAAALRMLVRGVGDRPVERHGPCGAGAEASRVSRLPATAFARSGARTGPGARHAARS